MGPFRDLVLLSFGRGLQVLAGLVTIKVATTILSPGELGSVNQMMSLAALGASGVLAPVATYIQRGFLEWLDAGTLRQRLGSYFFFILAVSVLFGLAIWMLQDRTSLVSGVSPRWVGTLVALNLLGVSAYTMAASGLNLLRHRLLYVVFGNIAVWGGLAFVLHLSQGGASPEIWLLGINGGFLLASLSYVFLFQYARRPASVHPAPMGEAVVFDRWNIFMFAWPQVIVYGLWWIQSQSYRFVLNWVSDIASVGMFAAAYMICSVPIQMFETLFNDFYSPKLYESLKNHDAAGIVRAWNAYACAYIPAVLLFGAFIAGNAVFLVKLVLGEQFQAVAPILIWPALTETMRASASSLYTLGIAKVDMRVNLPSVIAGAMTAPVLVMLFAPHNPLLGTALALLGAGGAALAVGLYVSYRTLPVTWPVRRIGVAAVLGLLLGAMGYILNAMIGELTTGKAALALVVSSLVMVSLQYAMGKKWLREMPQSSEVAA